jgi:hypothetical protein
VDGKKIDVVAHGRQLVGNASGAGRDAVLTAFGL